MELSDRDDPVRMMINAIHEGCLETVVDILENNTDIFMTEINKEKLIQGLPYESKKYASEQDNQGVDFEKLIEKSEKLPANT